MANMCHKVNHESNAHHRRWIWIHNSNCRRLQKLDRSLPRSQQLLQGHLQRPRLCKWLQRALPSRHLQQRRRRVRPCRQCRLQLNRRYTSSSASFSSSSRGIACACPLSSAVILCGVALGYMFLPVCMSLGFTQTLSAAWTTALHCDTAGFKGLQDSFF